MTMKDKDLVKLLEKNGWKLIRINGSHHTMSKDNNVITVPNTISAAKIPAIILVANFCLSIFSFFDICTSLLFNLSIDIY